MTESELHYPVVTYLEKQGYAVSCEVNDCDIVARKHDELLIIELKTRLSVALLIQAVKRKEITPSVYICIPVPEGKRSLSNLGNIKHLLRNLEIGLITVTFLKTKIRTEVLLHPKPYKQRMSRKHRLAILREIDGRYAELNRAGSPAAREKINAYKQQSLKIALLLAKHGPLAPKQLRSMGTGEKTGRILADNLYGWFDRVERGVYSLNPAGEQSLHHYQHVIQQLFE
jgi:hypothetical protein